MSGPERALVVLALIALALTIGAAFLASVVGGAS